MEERIAGLKEKLKAFIVDESGRDVTVEEVRPLAGGASRETWAVTAEVGEERLALALRLDKASTMNPEAISRAEEFELLRAAYEAGVTCPRPYWLCTDPAVLGAPFFLMEYVAGESIGPRVVRRPELAGARDALPEQMATELARIHALDPAMPDLAFLPRPVDGVSPAQHTVDNLRGSLAKLGVHSPGLSAGLRWLEQNQPPAGDLYVLHGDFRVGNLIVDEEGLAAVIDWEFAHLGDPVEDVAWPLVRDWRFGNDEKRLGGVGDAGPYLAAYEEKAGREVDQSAVTYWEIMGNMKWAVTCLVQAERHLSGADPSVELASLGRRSAEMEMELLNLIAEEGETGVTSL
ncbi:MAG: phosphotransferase family protein [Candidatus Promineifilaceae bacterium]|nr:phosphotransferase family protein [Candidatus Promineifilaceae bacterium]